jgi:CheY-like chemotaxis protein
MTSQDDSTKIDQPLTRRQRESSHSIGPEVDARIEELEQQSIKQRRLLEATVAKIDLALRVPIPQMKKELEALRLFLTQSLQKSQEERSSTGAKKEEESSNEMPAHGRRIRILVVDDEASIRSLCCLILQEADIDTVEAGNAESALAILSIDQSFDLILTDIHLPGSSGVDLLHAVRSMGLNIKILVMTGYDTNDRIVQTVAHNASGIIKKPFQIEDLLEAVRKAIWHS